MNDDDGRLLSAQDVAERLRGQVPVTRIRQAGRTGELRSVVLGPGQIQPQRRYRWPDVLVWLDSLASGGPKPMRKVGGVVLYTANATSATLTYTMTHSNAGAWTAKAQSSVALIAL